MRRPARVRQDRRKAVRVRPRARADTCQRHHDHVVRPGGRSGEGVDRAERVATRPEVEGQHGGRPAARCPQFSDERRVGHGLGADHSTSDTRALPSEEVAAVGDAGVDPELDVGKGGVDRSDRSHVVALPLDRVDVGEIEGSERMQPQQCRRDLDRVGADRE